MDSNELHFAKPRSMGVGELDIDRWLGRTIVHRRIVIHPTHPSKRAGREEGGREGGREGGSQGHTLAS